MYVISNIENENENVRRRRFRWPYYQRHKSCIQLTPNHEQRLLWRQNFLVSSALLENLHIIRMPSIFIVQIVIYYLLVIPRVNADENCHQEI